MGRITQDKVEIINEILNKYFHLPKYKKTEKCPVFSPELTASYMEKKLSPEMNIKYEKHLFQCKYCLDIYTNLKNEIDVLYKTKLRKISRDLLTEAFQLAEEEYEKNKSDFNKSKIVVKIMEKGFELIEAVNFNKIKPVLIPALRNKTSFLLKEILFEADYNNKVYQIRIQSYLNNMFSITLSFPDDIYEEIKENRLELISGDTRINKNIEKDVFIEGLAKGNYELLINQSLLLNLEII